MTVGVFMEKIQCYIDTKNSFVEEELLIAQKSSFRPEYGSTENGPEAVKH